MTIPSILNIHQIETSPEQYLAAHGDIFAIFGENTQDSGNISYGVQIGEDRFFVKTAGLPNDPKPFLTHPERVALLETAVSIAKTCPHPALVKLHHLIQSPHGPMLVYDWVAGKLVRSVISHFQALAVVDIVAALDVIYELHLLLADDGWVALDFYDGCLIYDFEAKVLRVVDLDLYRKRPFRNEMGRLFGSSRYMPPEAFELGAMIDQRSTVFTMGRTAVNLLSDGTLNRKPFRGSNAQFTIIKKACQPKPSDRFQTMREFMKAWNKARK